MFCILVLRCLVLDVCHRLSLFLRVVLGPRGDAFLSVRSGFSFPLLLLERLHCGVPVTPGRRPVSGLCCSPCLLQI